MDRDDEQLQCPNRRLGLIRRLWLRSRAETSEISQRSMRFPVSCQSRKGFDEKLALVIPTLCEARNIAKLLDEVRSVVHPLGIAYEIVVVDDDSEDGTSEIVSAIARADDHVRLIVRKAQRGLSGAILHGWQSTDATILGVIDADFQHPPELLPKLIATAFGGNDLVIGSRYTNGGELGNWKPIRRLLSLAAVWATWPIQRKSIRVKDPMSGFFLVRRRCLEGATFQSSGFKLLLDILVRARLTSVEEVPMSFGRRINGASKADFRVGRDYAQLLTRLYAWKFVLRSFG